MEPALIAAAVSGVTALAALLAAWRARVEADKLSDAKVVQVTVDAAGNLVDLVNAQLVRSRSDLDELAHRVDKLENQLTESRNQERSLRMQLGKVTKRVRVLEGFIREIGYEPPVETS